MINGNRVPRIDEFFCLARQRDHVVSNNPYADIMKVVVRKVGDVPLLLRQGMTFVTASTGIKELPTPLGGITDCILVAGDERVKGGIKGKLGAFVGRDGP